MEIRTRERTIDLHNWAFFVGFEYRSPETLVLRFDFDEPEGGLRHGPHSKQVRLRFDGMSDLHVKRDELEHSYESDSLSGLIEWVQDHLGLIRDAWNRAEAKGAQADLRLSLAIALAYFVEHGSFAGFTPGEARTIDRALTFNLEETVFGEVSIREASDTAALFTTESASGAVFCAANLRKRDTTTLLGTVDAITVSECAGGWPE